MHFRKKNPRKITKRNPIAPNFGSCNGPSERPRYTWLDAGAPTEPLQKLDAMVQSDFKSGKTYYIGLTTNTIYCRYANKDQFGKSWMKKWWFLPGNQTTYDSVEAYNANKASRLAEEAI